MSVKQLRAILADVPDKYDILIRDEIGQEWSPQSIIRDDNRWLCFIQNPEEYRMKAVPTQV